MSVTDIRQLLEKYQAGTCTPEELEALEAWYENFRHPDAADMKWEADEELTASLMQDFKEMQRRKEKLFRNNGWSNWWKAAAVIIPLAGIGTFMWMSRPSATTAISGPVLAEVPAQPDTKRFILLPDSSTVVLREGSTLLYPSVFSDGERVVTLTGEGYFDVREQPGKPFRIRSGKLLTTVLGTAFSIKAYPGQEHVTVTVSRGKVKIEEQESNRLLGILGQDQQIVYENVASVAETRPVKAEESVAWLKKGMDFNSVPFGDIAQQISEQYQVKIEFANNELRNCRIRATFEGTETLDQVLFVLCTVRNATYTHRGNTVIISGEGCRDEEDAPAS
ncbi:FecR family protein [Chitinophaga deserti]|uniref:FecR family protein n=1 Tax=Chitinophaga deserti TaxID=2164099 RepID=UPI000D6BD312|nr:FecR domain-containing protein [Chitinophaga deserti]